MAEGGVDPTVPKNENADPSEKNLDVNVAVLLKSEGLAEAEKRAQKRVNDREEEGANFGSFGKMHILSHPDEPLKGLRVRKVIPLFSTFLSYHCLLDILCGERRPYTCGRLHCIRAGSLFPQQE